MANALCSSVTSVNPNGKLLWASNKWMVCSLRSFCIARAKKAVTVSHIPVVEIDFIYSGLKLHWALFSFLY